MSSRVSYDAYRRDTPYRLPVSRCSSRRSRNRTPCHSTQDCPCPCLWSRGRSARSCLFRPRRAPRKADNWKICTRSPWRPRTPFHTGPARKLSCIVWRMVYGPWCGDQLGESCPVRRIWTPMAADRWWGHHWSRKVVNCTPHPRLCNHHRLFHLRCCNHRSPEDVWALHTDYGLDEPGDEPGDHIRRPQGKLGSILRVTKVEICVKLWVN